ncbi:MAG TPA: ATP-binding protein [Thermoanaerobaculia bacterium]|nr:ATP-binding protein [Thermoanaerobaculia bacterium]
MLARSVGAKLFTLLFLVLLLNLGLLGFANVRLHREHLEVADHAAADRINDIIRRSTSYYMLRNDRPALRHTVETIGQQPAIVGLRIYSADGRIGFSTNPADVGTRAEALPDRGTRIFSAEGGRVLAISTPIMNSQSCSSAACHAHPQSQELLGVLDTRVSLAAADADVAAATSQFISYSAAAILLTLAATAIFVWKFVHQPVTELRRGTERLGAGELGVQIPVQTRDELGALGAAFNTMSRELREARDEITAWTHTLEERVQRKTSELQLAQEQMIQAEKLTSLGKLAAVVAHEINNPLSGILTYAKLMRKWIDRGDDLAARSAEMRDALMLVESESRRCGEIVRNLLMFARAAPMNIADVDVNAIVRQCIRLVDHKLELGNIVADLSLAEGLPPVRGDAGQIEQLLLALVMNAIDAMPVEGVLRIATRSSGQDVVIEVEDNGTGIDPAILPRLFDPFVTTKEEGKGVGLGLAISRGIVDRHHGRIEVQSELGRGTKFTITVPAAVLMEASA